MWNINAPLGRIPCTIFTKFAEFVTPFQLQPSRWALAHVSSFHKIFQVTNCTVSQPLDNLSFRIQVHCAA